MKYRMGIIIFLIIFVSASSAFSQDFTINRFHSEIVINSDSSIEVKETIEVEFHRPRHGIYREIPFRYTDELGSTIKTPIKVLSVTDGSGRNLKYRVTRVGSAINIRIGNPDKFVWGRNTYVIGYTVDNAILFFDDHDELYWNVTGNYWKAPIKEASANVSIAVKDRSRELWAACYTGVYGSRESLCGFETSDNRGEFFTKTDLRTGEGFTIAFGWNKGLVSPPSAWKRFLRAIDIGENWVFIFPLFSLIFMINLWYRKGRDPRTREAITVMYEPPRYNNIPLSPAEVGTLVDEKMDTRDITASIVGLAVKGYLRIEEMKREGLIFDTTDYYLAKIKEPDANLNPFEKLLMERIFPGMLPGILVSAMKNRFYVNLDILKTTLYDGLVSKGYFFRSPEKVRRLYTIAGIVIAAGGFFIATMLTPFLQWKGIIAAVLSSLPVLAFSRVMPAKTRAGASVYMEIIGFREFLSRAEKDRIERMGDKDLFSRFLPYAIALDVADNWSEAFEGIYQDPPEWYITTGEFRTFRPSLFSSSIRTMTSSIGSAVISAPRGSGISGKGASGGGGFSGGGFGGGGGGSW